MTAECVAVLSSNMATCVSCVATNSDGLFVLVIRRSDCIDDGVNATVSCLFVVSTSMKVWWLSWLLKEVMYLCTNSVRSSVRFLILGNSWIRILSSRFVAESVGETARRTQCNFTECILDR